MKPNRDLHHCFIYKSDGEEYKVNTECPLENLSCPRTNVRRSHTSAFVYAAPMLH